MQPRIVDNPRPMRGSRRAVVAACAGNVVEWYDFALFGAAAAVIASVLAPGDWTGFVTIFAVFATSCLFRPLGSLVLGARADRWGRQRILAFTIVVMALATFAIGLLPPWSVVGWLAPLGLLALRAAQAFSAGGEIGVSVAFLTEWSAPERRGRTGGWYLATVALGLALGMAVTALVVAILPPADLAGWGWRIPFLLALPLGTVGAYLRYRLRDPPAFRPAPAPVSPRSVWRAHRRTIGRCFLISGAYSAAFNVWFVLLPGFLALTGGGSLARWLLGALVGLLSAAVSAPWFGRLSDLVGRRPVLLGAAAALVGAVGPLYLWMSSGSLPAILVGNAIVGLILAAFVLPVFLAEQFPSAKRATGIGLAYGLSSAFVGGTAPLVATLLARRLSDVAVPGYLLVWAVLGLLAIAWSPETRPSRTASD